MQRALCAVVVLVFIRMALRVREVNFIAFRLRCDCCFVVILCNLDPGLIHNLLFDAFL